MTEILEDAAPVTDSQLALCSVLAQRQIELQAEVNALEAQLAEKASALKVNMELDLPEAMSAAGQQSFTITGGYKVVLKRIVRASIPEAFHDQGIDYMMGVAPDLVKHTVTIEFGKDQAEWFAAFMEHTRQLNIPINMTSRDAVNHMTLSKFVRDCDKAERVLPEEILGIHRARQAKVEAPKMGKEAIP